MVLHVCTGPWGRAKLLDPLLQINLRYGITVRAATRAATKLKACARPPAVWPRVLQAGQLCRRWTSAAGASSGSSHCRCRYAYGCKYPGASTRHLYKRLH